MDHARMLLKDHYIKDISAGSINCEKSWKKRRGIELNFFAYIKCGNTLYIEKKILRQLPHTHIADKLN